MLSIGEFSRVTQLSIKALRFYHRKGILNPDKIDYDSKYRYYRSSAVQKALSIKKLKDLGFSLNEIKKIILECDDDKQLIGYVREKLKEIDTTIDHYQNIKESLSLFLDSTMEEKINPSASTEDEVLPDMIICSIRFKGKYNQVGKYLVTLFKKCGRYSRGKPFTMYYDGEYKEDNADIEVCVEVKEPVNFDGINCRELKGGKTLTIVHKGTYEQLSRSYQRLYEECREKNKKILLPSREQYLKGPGFIFRGNPKKYLTKLMMLYE